MGDGLSRRELLKRGAIAGGALWATPIMHSIGIAQVESQDTSPGCRLTFTGEDPCVISDRVSFDIQNNEAFTVWARMRFIQECGHPSDRWFPGGDTDPGKVRRILAGTSWGTNFFRPRDEQPCEIIGVAEIYVCPGADETVFTRDKEGCTLLCTLRTPPVLLDCT